METSNKRVQAFALVNLAIELMLSDDGDPGRVEEYLKDALSLDPASLEALQEAAHFYDAVKPDRTKAERYATLCVSVAKELIAEMEDILADNGQSKKIAPLPLRPLLASFRISLTPSISQRNLPPTLFPFIKGSNL